MLRVQVLRVPVRRVPVLSAGVRVPGLRVAGSEGRGAANPVGAAPHFALRTGRVGQPGKHACGHPVDG